MQLLERKKKEQRNTMLKKKENKGIIKLNEDSINKEEIKKNIKKNLKDKKDLINKPLSYQFKKKPKEQITKKISENIKKIEKKVLLIIK